MKHFTVPLILIVFNRVEKTKQLIKILELLTPSNLYVVSDGPRLTHPDDQEKVEEIRELFNNIPWECDIKRIYSSKNLGLKDRVISGLNNVFLIEDKAIILEDDLQPSLDFFYFAAELLEKYKNSSNIFSVCGTNQFGTMPANNNESYFFSIFTNSWGWATWKDKWDLFNSDLSNYDILKANGFFKFVLKGKRSELYWKHVYNLVESGKINSWAYRWMMTSWLNNGVNVVPTKNLIRNVGVDNKATHTKSIRFYIKNPVFPIVFPLIHPKFPLINYNYDTLCENFIYSKSFLGRLKWLKEKYF